MVYLGKGGGNGSVRIYLAEDCFEIEDQRPVDIVHRRIYLDDVMLVAHSKRFGWRYLTGAGLICGTCGLIGLPFVLASTAGEYALIGWGLLLVALGAAVAFMVRMVTKLDVITIQGRRKHVEVAFGLNKDAVQRTFDMIVSNVRRKITETNERIARERPPEPAPAAEPPPEWAQVPPPGTIPLDAPAPPEWAPARGPGTQTYDEQPALSAALEDFRKAMDAPPTPVQPSSDLPPPVAPVAPVEPVKPVQPPKPPEDELPPFMPEWRKPPEPPRRPDSPDAWLPPKK